MHRMTRNDLPIVVVHIGFGGQRRYLGRLATVKEFNEFRMNCGITPADICYERWETSKRLSKDEAMQKWEHYTDSAIKRNGLSTEQQIEGLVAAGATEESLKAFWLEVKHFSWPGNWGQSPWVLAASLGAALEAQDLGPAFRAVGLGYVQPFREAFARHQLATAA